MEILRFISFAFFAAFAGVVPPGLINMSVAKIAVEKSKKQGIIASLGAGVVNFIQAFISILMARYIIGHASVQSNMLKFGVVVFAGLTIYFLYAGMRNKPQKEKVEKKEKSSRRSFAKGFFLANLNILPIPYFVLISAQLSTKTDNAYDWLHIILFSLSTALGTFTVLYLYIIAFLKLGKGSNLIGKYANFFMAGLMFILCVTTIIRAYHA